MEGLESATPMGIMEEQRRRHTLFVGMNDLQDTAKTINFTLILPTFICCCSHFGSRMVELISDPHDLTHTAQLRPEPRTSRNTVSEAEMTAA